MKQQHDPVLGSLNATVTRIQMRKMAGTGRLRWFDRLAIRLTLWAVQREPDFVIGGSDNPYLLRWYLTPWRRWREVPAGAGRFRRALGWASRCLPVLYLHQFRRSDDDRALHDHPWLFNASLLIYGRYTEHTIDRGGIHRRRVREAGDAVLRWGGAPHRIELHEGWCWTLFLAGPVVRNWGFHCPAGWVPWQTFTDPADPGQAGRGCGEVDR